MVARTELPRNNPGRAIPAKSIGSVRRDNVMGNRPVRGENYNEGDNRGKNLRNLHYPKFLKRREEGKCFRCRGPFILGHPCLEKSLRVVLLAEDEEGDVEGTKAKAEPPCMELSAFSA